MTFAAWMNRVLRYLLPRLVMRPRIDRRLYAETTEPCAEIAPAFRQRLSMGHALIIALLFGSTLLAQADLLTATSGSGRPAGRTGLVSRNLEGSSGADRTRLTLLHGGSNQQGNRCLYRLVSFPVVSASDC